MLFVPYIYVICTVHLLFVPYIFLDYIKSCPDKYTLFIICYLIQFILKIVHHVANYVSSSSETQLFITPAIDVWYTTNKQTVNTKQHIQWQQTQH
jgi:hypothetical protein